MGNPKKTKSILNPFSSKNKKRFKDAINPLRGDASDNFAMNPANPLKEAVSDTGEVFTPEMPAPEQQPIIPMPDESMLEDETRRRRARQSRTGRRSTILSGETLGG